MQPYRTPDRDPDPEVTFGSEKKRILHLIGAFGSFAVTAVAIAALIGWLTGLFHGGFRLNFYFLFLPVIGVRLLRRARGGMLTFRRDTRELVVTTKRALSSEITVFPASDVLDVTTVTVAIRNGDPEYLLQLSRRNAPPVPLVQSPKHEEIQPWDREVHAFLQDLDLVPRPPPSTVPKAEETSAVTEPDEELEEVDAFEHRRGERK